MFRVIQVSILAVALSALFAPTAFADRPDDKAGKIGVGSVQPTGATYAHPDDRADARGPGAYEERFPELVPQALVQTTVGSTGRLPASERSRRSRSRCSSSAECRCSAGSGGTFPPDVGLVE